MFGLFRKDPKMKSLRPKKKHKNEAYQNLHKNVKASLGANNNFEEVVKQKGDSMEEWFAVNVVDFYNNLSLVVGAVENKLQQCTATMSAGEFEYLWKNDKDSKYKKPTALKPFDFINCTFDYVEDMLNDPKVFPTEGEDFPKNFKKNIKDIFKKLYRVWAHLFVEEFEELEKTGLVAHINTSFKHFLVFAFEYKLIKKTEFVPLNEWILNNLGKKYKKHLKLPKGKKEKK